MKFLLCRAQTAWSAESVESAGEKKRASALVCVSVSMNILTLTRNALKSDPKPCF